MNRRRFLFLCCLLILVCLAGQITNAGGSWTINETRTSFFFGPHDSQVSLTLVNPSTPAAAKIRLDLLTPNDTQLATAELTTTIANGEHKVPIRLPFSIPSSEKTPNDLLWLRLRCRVEPNASTPVETIMSLGQIAPELFEIEATSSPMLHERMRYQSLVRAFHPFTNVPAKGVRIAGQFEFTDRLTSKRTQVKSGGVTDADGYAALTYNLPESLAADDIEVTIKGQRGPLQVEANKEPLFYSNTQLFVSTDKPLYQPGQTLHVRALAFGTSMHALSGRDLTLRINDPDAALLFQSELKTSRFGVIAADWQIPENSRLGDYEIEFRADGDTLGTRRFKVSRYELPNFSINIKPDKSFYLPGQSAQVIVKAEYLFGQPVKKGHVRVVRETERNWNYVEQKYEIKEGPTHEGDTDSSGNFTALIDLAEEQADFEGSEYQKFLDLKYAAYFTDPTTNRTEQRRFVLRITKDPIHVYAIHLQDRYRESSRTPLSIYASTFYADGRPARCSVQLRQKMDDSEAVGPVLMTVRTNSFGLAKIDRLNIPEKARAAAQFDLMMEARDARGQTGSSLDDIELHDDPVLRITTNKTLYAAGEPIEVTITSSEKELTTVFEVVQDWSVSDSRIVKLHGGRTSFTLPYKNAYKDAFSLAAYSGRADEDPIFATRPVLFPRNQNLRLDVRSDRRSYRPGDSAHVDFRIRNRDDQFSESSLGVVVVDQAVNERVRSLDEFDSGSADFHRDLIGQLGGESVVGITRAYLDNIDMTRPVPPDLALAAEVFLNSSKTYFEERYGNDYYSKDPGKLFSDQIKKRLSSVSAAIYTHDSRTGVHPRDLDSMRGILKEANLDFDQLLDPWGTPYRVEFSTRDKWDVMKFIVAGPDKRFETLDDFSLEPTYWLYFKEIGEAINRAVFNYHERTGDFIRNKDTLRTELASLGINLDELRDRWSQPYEFTFKVAESNLVLSVTSTGPDRKKNQERYYGDDFEVWSTLIDYFTENREKINAALKLWATKHGSFPESENDANAALKDQGILISSLKDQWGKTYRLALTIKQTYDDKASIANQTSSGNSQQHITLKPVTNRIGIVELLSTGLDRTANTADDFAVATFVGVISSRSADQAAERPSSVVVLPAGKGAVSGEIKDMNGATITGATVKATGPDKTTFETTTDNAGHFLLSDLTAGIYEVRVQASGFKALIVIQVVVIAGNVVELSLTMEPGAVAETVNVTAAASVIDTSSSAMVGQQINDLPISGREFSKFALLRKKESRNQQQLTETPRLRNYFPETLVWQPSLETNKRGWAQLNFKLADNITTWKMSVIGSTEDGQLGYAEKEITAFQPFFVEHDPPRVLTEGDEISLPVVVRNYLSKPQKVNLSIKPETWFTLLGPANRDSRIGADDAARESFDFRAIASIKDGNQRITAQGLDANDAIEKPITVHPDGEEQSAGAAGIVGEMATLKLDLPASLVPNSARGELKIYPNLAAHVAESVEAILQRPYGCGEQTISSTYPSLLIVRYSKQTGQKSALFERAERYLQAGYARLQSYSVEGGGFSYWGKGKGDVALTAYALRFLNDASKEIAVDEKLVEQARSWLAQQQRPDGSWTAYPESTPEHAPQDALLTAYVLRTLASPAQSKEKSGAVIGRAFSYLEAHVAMIDEPYFIASVALAAADMKNTKLAELCNSKLVSLAHAEGDSTYWNLEINTPFYGWGSAGRIETTALVLQALVQACERKSDRCPRELLKRGLLFLLKEKDRYGVWYSSQATINVLDALLALLPADISGGQGSTYSAEISVNGVGVKSVQLRSGREALAPILIDISTYLRVGSNRIELRRPNGWAPASMQAVATYYVPWQPAAGPVRSGDSSALRLVTKFDRTEARVNDQITCHVEAERVGHRGYGMLLAEIGLPPGADVDRESLDNAMKNSGWAINQYDVLPDRVVFYLWPQAGGVNFDFRFKPRFGLKAKAAASSVYDYYNPEARASVAPAKFVIN